MWSRANHAAVTVGGVTVPLVGLTQRAAQTAEKIFGVGYAQYRYTAAAGLRMTRTLSVMPSLKPGNGTSAFVLSVALRNEIGEPLDVTYVESVKAAYKQAFSQWGRGSGPPACEWQCREGACAGTMRLSRARAASPPVFA